MVNFLHDVPQRVSICTWIGHHIEAVNRRLHLHLLACHACFHPWEQRVIQIFAAPLSPAFGIDGLCNLQTQPVTILIDVGRVVPQHWLRLVAHEYAHAHAGSPGHHQQFAASLAHLCLGLAIALPSQSLGDEASLRSYPVCRSTLMPLAFWRGHNPGWQTDDSSAAFE